jgi:hypothetical protein
MPLTPGLAVTPAVVDPLLEFAQTTGLQQMPMVYGVGDHGGGPTRADLRQLIEMDKWPVFPNFVFSTLHGFFRAAEAALEAGTARAPEIVGERNRVFTGCYTSQARQKWAQPARRDAALCRRMSRRRQGRAGGRPLSPGTNLEEAWTRLLFDQFHDILPAPAAAQTRALTPSATRRDAGGWPRVATTNDPARARPLAWITESLRRDFESQPGATIGSRVESGGAGRGRGQRHGGPAAVSAFGADAFPAPGVPDLQPAALSPHGSDSRSTVGHCNSIPRTWLPRGRDCPPQARAVCVEKGAILGARVT